MTFVWFFLLSVSIGIFQDKNSKKKAVILGALFFAASMIVPLVWYTYQGMALTFTLLGIGNAIVQVSAGAGKMGKKNTICR